MNVPTLEQQRYLVNLWKTTGPLLDKIRLEALRGMPHDPKVVADLLSMADNYDGPPRLTSGLVEMQRVFIKMRDREAAPGATAD